MLTSFQDFGISRNKYVDLISLADRRKDSTDPSIAPLIYSWSAANTAGETKKKVTTGILFIGQCAGNVRYSLPVGKWSSLNLGRLWGRHCTRRKKNRFIAAAFAPSKYMCIGLDGVMVYTVSVSLFSSSWQYYMCKCRTTSSIFTFHH